MSGDVVASQSSYIIQNVDGILKFVPHQYTCETLTPDVIISDPSQPKNTNQESIREFNPGVLFGMSYAFTQGVQENSQILEDQRFCLTSIHTIFKLLSDFETLMIQPELPMMTLHGQTVSNTIAFQQFLKDSYGNGDIPAQITDAAGLEQHSLQPIPQGSLVESRRER